MFLDYLTMRNFIGKIVTMVKQVTKVMTKDPTVVAKGHLISLGKDRNRWSIAVPQQAIKFLGRNTIYEVTLKPLGSICIVRNP